MSRRNRDTRRAAVVLVLLALAGPGVLACRTSTPTTDTHAPSSTREVATPAPTAGPPPAPIDT